MIDFSNKEVLSFDCYGTLIDWESGISQVLQPILHKYGVNLTTEQLLEIYGKFESEVEAGPYKTYREVLASVLQNFGQIYHFSPIREELEFFSNSVGDWPPFADTSSALASLKERFKLVIISNVDDDLFARSNQQLGVEFDWIITAQQARSYKPSRHNFEVAFDRVGLPPARFVHVAQSLFHDHIPAKALGLDTVWVNRRGEKAGAGATPAIAIPVVPDLEVPDLATLATLVTR